EMAKANEQVLVFVPPVVKPKPTTAPDTTGVAASIAAAALAKLGVLPEEIRRFDARKPGTVIEQIPPKGTPLKAGTQVQLIVSAGSPQVVSSDGRDIGVMNGATGKNSRRLTTSPDLEDEPVWQPNGALVAYRRGPSNDTRAGKIWLLDASGHTAP